MTVAGSLKTWLMTNESIELLEDIDTDFLQAEAESAGTYKQPSDNVLVFIDGTKQITSYYLVLFRQASKLEAERLSNAEFMEAFENWVEDQDNAENYPAGINCQRVAIANSYYMQEADVSTAVYQISIAITYNK